MNYSIQESDSITEKILESAECVSSILGFGFSSEVYLRSLAHELEIQGLNIELNYPLNVYYKDSIVGEFFADILVENLVLVIVKSNQKIAAYSIKKCINYLKASKLNCCLLLNFSQNSLENEKIII